MRVHKLSGLRGLMALALFASAAQLAAAQKESKGEDAPPRGTPVLWRAPDDIAARDLFWGAGGEASRPDLSSVTFVKQESGGYSPKFRVRDGAGRVWVAKLGKEAQSETAAVRLVWAVGYATEINYLAPCVRIKGVPKLPKEVERCANDGFSNVRFEARPENVKRLDEWKWDDNPFTGTKELRGLIILMALLNNWDIKDTNNKVLHVRGAGAGRDELQYVVSDLGATFGRVKVDLPVVWRIRRNRNDPDDYGKDPFLEEVKGDRVFLFYKGKRQDLFDDLRVGEARWIASLLSKLSARQIADAFRAANYAPAEVQTLAAAVRSRVGELARATGVTASATGATRGSR
ncbi:MAG: hypothetical protein LC785_14795 [Acidobacteria bacterium]|nr:hypothetical protein [Acidobacteriota bacterium]MCA1643180.1 hypothetical protein [Acidobacteriota bacterium]